MALNAKDRAAWRLVQDQVPALTDKEAQAVIDSWRQNGLLETRSYQDPVYRRKAWDCSSIGPNVNTFRLCIMSVHIAFVSVSKCEHDRAIAAPYVSRL